MKGANSIQYRYAKAILGIKLGQEKDERIGQKYKQTRLFFDVYER